MGETKGGLKSIVGAEVADKCGPIWGLNSEGELCGVWRDLGVRGLWSATGKQCRVEIKATLNTRGVVRALGCLPLLFEAFGDA